MNYEINKKGRYGVLSPVPDNKLSLILEKGMSYEKQNAQYFPNKLWAIVKLYKIRTGTFPIGLTSRVKVLLDTWISLGNKDTYDIKYSLKGDLDPEKLKLLSTKLRDYQKDAILQLILNSGGIVSIPTGAGKTFIAIEYIKYMTMLKLH